MKLTPLHATATMATTTTTMMTTMATALLRMTLVSLTAWRQAKAI
jgi:hypothetical protein